MRSLTKSGVAIATILAASLGFANLTQATPLAGVTAAVPAVQMTGKTSASEAPLEKAYYYRRYYHRPYYHRPYYHRPYYHRPYYHRRYY
jgi:hypothetical protein